MASRGFLPNEIKVKKLVFNKLARRLAKGMKSVFSNALIQVDHMSVKGSPNFNIKHFKNLKLNVNVERAKSTLRYEFYQFY